MTVPMFVKVTCAACNTTSSQARLASTSAFGSPDLDLRPPEMQRSTMCMWVQQCPECGYIANSLDQKQGDISRISSPEYQQTLHNADRPERANRFLAQALLLEKTDPAAAARARLHAAWSCDDAGTPEQQTACRRLAADTFEAAIQALETATSSSDTGSPDAAPADAAADDENKNSHYNNEDADADDADADHDGEDTSREHLTLRLVLIDILRRAHEFDRAASACTDVLQHHHAADLQPIMRRVLTFQQHLIKIQDTTTHTLDTATEFDPDEGTS